MIVFDLDGTLVDSAPDLRRALNAVLDEEGLPALDLSLVRAAIGDGARALVLRGFRSRGRELDGAAANHAVKRFRDAYARHPAVHTRLYPGWLGVLTTLEQRGIPMALCTNKPERHTDLVLEALELKRFFEIVVGGDTLTERKPSAAPLRHILERVGRRPAEAVLIGDSGVDAAAAAAAGMDFLFAPWGYGGGAAKRSALGSLAEPAALLDWLGPLEQRWAAARP